MEQKKQNEWHEQWKLLSDNELFLFRDWIYPNTTEDFRGKEVLECGCGGGQHTSFIAPYVKKIVAVDLNTTDIAKTRNNMFTNIEYIAADIAMMDLRKQFDIVFSIGVIHHTDDPDCTIQNIKRHIKPGGKLIVWVYSKEGNFLIRHFVEPIRKLCFRKTSRKSLLGISKLITALLYFPVYSLYLLPLRFLPYYEYFGNFRKLTFNRNTLNVFDKLNAPQVQFIARDQIQRWFTPAEFINVNISAYKGVSWRGSGTYICQNYYL